MKIYSCLVALRGERGNTVPVSDATVAELAVLAEIHTGNGGPAVFDIEEAGEVPWGNRTERNRLARKYPKKIGKGTIVDVLWPGPGSPVAETLDELHLPDEAFKTTARAIPAEVLAQREEEAAAAAPAKRRKRKAETPEPEEAREGLLA